MNWKLKVIWIALTLSAVNMIACGQKKEQNNGRPPLAAGVTAGKEATKPDTTTPDATSTVSKMPVEVDGQLLEASVSDIHTLKNTSDEEAIAQISLTITFNKQTQNIILKPTSTESQQASYESGVYTISYTSVCTKACAKLYFVATVTNHETKKDQSQIAVVTLLDGTAFYDNKTQESFSVMGEANIKTVEQVIKLLDQKSTKADAADDSSKDSTKKAADDTSADGSAKSSGNSAKSSDATKS